MMKYYVLLFIAAGLILYYIFLQDPCNSVLRQDFSAEHPDYKILSSGAREGSPETVRCFISYRKPASKQTYEDIWLYQDTGNGWNFARVVETREIEETP